MKLIKNIFKTFILVSGTSHLLILFIYTIIKRDMVTLNYFNVLDIDLFFPNIINGALSQILSIITIMVIGSIIYFTHSNKANI